MDSQQLRQYLDIIDQSSSVASGADMDEADHTDEIDFSDSDTFADVIDKIQGNELNRLGFGDYRETWHHPFDKRLVIKVAKCREGKKASEQDCALRNVWEYLVWYKAYSQNLPEKEHLMPCVDCDANGKWLTMFKGTRVPDDSAVSIKDEMSWVGDRKKDNFRQRDGKTLAVDYGTTKAVQHMKLPEDSQSAVRLLQQVLSKLNKPTQDPNYGKSTPHSDPTHSSD